MPPMRRAPTARERAPQGPEALLDAAAEAGTLPAVVFVKPDGTANQHPGESTMAAGDLMIGTIVARSDAARNGATWR